MDLVVVDQFTLPISWYVDPRMLELEQELIFGRTWIWVGRVDQVATPGAYFTSEIADEPIVVVRGTDGILRAFSNVCRHRAGPVAQGNGILKRFQCAYHGWTYGLDGSLLGTPYFKGVEGFVREANCLPQFQVATWGPLVFVNLDPHAPSLEDTLGDLPKRFSRYQLEDLAFHSRLVLEAACNWKLQADNSRECYHCATVHPSFRIAYRLEDVREETSNLWSLMYVPERCDVSAQDTDLEIPNTNTKIVDFYRQSHGGELTDEEKNGNYYVFMFPELVLGFQPDHVWARRLIPRGVDRVTIVRDYFIEKSLGPVAKAAFEKNAEFRLQVIKEDLAILEEVQRNLHTRYFGRGPYSSKEQCVQHFHSLLRRFLDPKLSEHRS